MMFFLVHFLSAINFDEKLLLKVELLFWKYLSEKSRLVRWIIYNTTVSIFTWHGGLGWKSSFGMFFYDIDFLLYSEVTATRKVKCALGTEMHDMQWLLFKHTYFKKYFSFKIWFVLIKVWFLHLLINFWNLWLFFFSQTYVPLVCMHLK